MTQFVPMCSQISNRLESSIVICVGVVGDDRFRLSTDGKALICLVASMHISRPRGATWPSNDPDHPHHCCVEHGPEKHDRGLWANRFFKAKLKRMVERTPSRVPQEIAAYVVVLRTFPTP